MNKTNTDTQEAGYKAKRSRRKPHNHEAGYIAERIFQPSRSHVVIYHSDSQELDTQGNRYAVVCTKHCALLGEKSLPKARQSMKYPQFCNECMEAENWSLRDNPRFLEAVKLSRDASLPASKARAQKLGLKP